MDVFCFPNFKGANSHGQLGIGCTEDKDEPTPVATSLKPDIITGGGVFSVLVEGSTIWGAGQLGPKEESERQTRLRMLGKVEEGIKAVSCGWDFLVVLSKTGKVYFRGHNSPGFVFNKSTPMWIGELSPVVLDVAETRHIGAGLRHVVVVSCTGEVFEWKGGKVREVVVDKKGAILGCSTGAHHTVLWTDDGCVGVWGDVRFGQGGPSMDEADGLPRRSGRVLWISSACFLNERVVDVQSGWSHILALTESGKVFSWGRCDFGQLGRTIGGAAMTSMAWPQSGSVFDATPDVVSLPASSVRLISAGAEHCLAVIGETEVWMWGWNEHGNCGAVETSPASASSADAVVVRMSEGGASRLPLSRREGWCVALPRRVSFAGKGKVVLAAACYGYSMVFTDT
ncbi:unnamed protein product [Hydatigera taeniaeformis]|uniref:Regulator of chromosome condensation (RCC1) family protein n=1 Tax=Hydatigena taeniaeformis TaxID=6205 RepID=A0A0R3WVJ3_HYDTA|nr:unnamed protein product [Hydatigera taeniaeformis]